MVFHWSLSDSKSPQVSRTLLSILAVLNNAVVWMASTRPPTSKSTSPFSNPLVTVPNAPITIGIIVTCMFHILLLLLLSLLFIYFSIIGFIHIYLLIFYLHKYFFVNIYIYRERERGRERAKAWCIYIYITDSKTCSICRERAQYLA